MATGSWKIGELSIAKGNLITAAEDRNFDGGTVGNWVVAGSNTGAVISASTDQARSGTYSLKIDAGTSITNVYTRIDFSNTTANVSGKKYRFSAWIYVPSGSGFTSIILNTQSVSDDSLSNSVPWDTTTFDKWVQIRIDINIASDTTGLYRATANTTTDNEIYYIDDVSIVEIPPLQRFEQGTKYLKCITTGVIRFPLKGVAGTVEFDYWKSPTGNNLVSFMNDTGNGIPNFNGYTVLLASAENLIIQEYTGSSGSTILSSAVSYITDSTWYRYKVTRSSAGEFTFYVRGGAFGDTDWTLVDVSGGSGTNPITDTTTTTSNYLVLDMVATSRIANFKFTRGIEQ